MTPARLFASLAAMLCIYVTLDAGQQERPAFRTSTWLVEISVIVTDKDRNPVPGLLSSDFQIFDDGQLHAL